MNDDLFELASAYLDGEATPDERARVEADPELTALVARLREVSASVRDVPAADPHDRDRAVAAAVAARTGSAGDPGPERVVVPLRRPRTTRLLSYAAAVLVVGVLGVVVVGGIRGGDTDDSASESTSDAPASAELFTTDDGDGSVEDPADDSGDTELFATESAPEVRDGEAGDDADPTADDPTADDPTADDPTAEDTGEDTSEDTGDHSDDPADTSTGGTVIDLATLDDEQLAVIVDELARRDDGDSSSDRPCADVLDVVFAPDDAFTFDGGPALMGTAGDTARVVDPTDCSVLTEVTPERSAG